MIETSPSVAALAAAMAKTQAAIWSAIPGQSEYFASYCGKVLSMKSGRVISGTRCGIGYRAVDLPGEGRVYVHRLICRLFHGAPATGQVVRHIDGNLDNNHAENLIWGSQAENSADKIRHGTDGRGERNSMAKLTQAIVMEMRRQRATYGDSYNKIAARFGVSTMTAHRAINGVSWNG